MPPFRANTLERFWQLVDKTDDHWLWTAGIGDCGYGLFTFEGKQWRTHRLAYRELVGPLDPALVIDHLCEIKACVRPEHLEQVSGPENTRRIAVRNYARGMSPTKGNPIVQTRVGQDVKLAIEAKAKADGLTVSEWTRRTLTLAATGKPSTGPKVVIAGRPAPKAHLRGCTCLMCQ